MIPIEKWEWSGYPEHFIAAGNCRFRLGTRVGRYIVSTVGDYHPASSPKDGPPEIIGMGRLYETFVFDAPKRRTGKCKECGFHHMDEPTEIDSLPANDAETARRNHMRLCRKWAKRDTRGSE